ncbi:MAG: PilZ domain-containing protein [Candidatus Zixiibacteriota bacterium]|nr:MAG: PilZ domain-containing protein [candidate division Zixibacteria bacterium]
MVEERKLKRMQVTSYLKICYRDTDIEPGRVVDITTEGMRLCGEEPIQTDRTLTFKLALPTTFSENKVIVFDADVIWCRRAKNPDLYDTGIKLKNLSPEKVGIIKNFMEDSSYDDRWLSIIKSLNEEF